jgi:hypothetical protein
VVQFSLGLKSRVAHDRAAICSILLTPEQVLR